MRVTPTTPQIRAAFDAVRHSPAFAESSKLFDGGRLPVEMTQAMSLRPELLQAFGAMSEAVYPGGVVERRVKELIILEASRTNQCQFCTASHVSIAQMLGIGDESGDPLRLLDRPELMNDRERLAVDYTRAAQRDANRIPAQLFDDLRAHYTEPEIVELTAMIGLITMLNMFNNCLQVTYRGEYAQS
ncbi:MAG: carboxymuconolactone decarboxylase family protein [Phycisphaerae bacterium]|nr:carboxymuconolactone decarboxylase family protein [Phycisphaerae bacterium]